MSLSRKVLEVIESGINGITVIDGDILTGANFDSRYFNKDYWKVNQTGQATNQFMVLYNTPAPTTSYVTSNAPLYTLNKEVTQVILSNVQITLNKKPSVVITNIKGSHHSVKQFYSPNDFEITVTSLSAGSLYYIQDSYTLSALVNVLDAGKTINVVNPELNIIYGIDKLICTGYSLEQDSKYYQVKSITLNFVSESDIDRFITTTEEGDW
jgi:hypothetical protein